MNILVLEASTTSAKTMIYHTDTDKSVVQTRPYRNMYDDVSKHDAKMVFEDLMELGKEAVRGHSIDMIALSGTWHSVFLCTEQMKPETPVYTWAYTGAADLCKRLRKNPEYVQDFYQRTGCMVNAIYPAFKLQLLKEQGYDLKKYRIMGQGSYNTYRLTGERVTTACMASGSGLLNIKEKRYDKKILQEIGIKPEQLAELVAYNQTFPLSKEGAFCLGLPEGIPVLPANSDGGLNQVGVGALEEGVMTFSVGTSGALRLTTPDVKLPETPSTWCYLSPKAYLSGAATSGCCNCIDWFKRENKLEQISYDELESKETEGMSIPVFLPFLFGERCPGWDDERRGGFRDATENSTIQELYRAIQEGVLFNLYQCYQCLTKLNGIPQRVKLSGGILFSKEWTQMCADIFQIDLEIDSHEQGSLLGGAVLAMEVLKVLDKAEDFKEDTVQVIHPRRDKAEEYKKRYKNYLTWYQKTEEI